MLFPFAGREKLVPSLKKKNTLESFETELVHPTLYLQTLENNNHKVKPQNYQNENTVN